jgi:WD40 repeat protein
LEAELVPLKAASAIHGARTIRLWDVTTGAVTARLEEHIDWEGLSGGVRALCVLPDGRLAAASGDGTIRLWDVTTAAETARLE